MTNQRHLARARAVLAETPSKRDRRRILPHLPTPTHTTEWVKVHGRWTTRTVGPDDRPRVPDSMRAHNVQVAPWAKAKFADKGRPLTFTETRVSKDPRWSDKTWNMYETRTAR